MAKLRVTQTRSCIGRNERQRATLRHLGLRRMNATVVVDDNPIMRGMIKKVEHMVAVAPAGDE